MNQFNIEKQGDLLIGLTEPLAFVTIYNNVVKELDSLGDKYGIDISNCIRIERGDHGVAFRITEAITEVGTKIGDLVTEIFIITYKNQLAPLEFVFVENEPKESYKFLSDKVFRYGDSLSPGGRIMKASLHKKIPLSIPYYQTLDDLLMFDPGFIKLKKENSQFASTISEPENIINAKGFVITKGEGDVNSLNALLLMHSISGYRGRKYFTGVHHIELPIPPFIKDFQVIDKPDKHGVYTATFLIAKESGRVISKKGNPSTMFPSDWSIQQFYLECYYALENKVSIDGSSTDFVSKTPSGVPVEIYFSPQGRFRTIYPIYTK